eukprot:scaffold12996_cov18-Tisochrysis_lutea.AAC.1
MQYACVASFITLFKGGSDVGTCPMGDLHRHVGYKWPLIKLSSANPPSFALSLIHVCSSHNVQLYARDQGTALSVSSLSPCSADVFFAKSWDDWKAAVLEAADLEDFQGGGCPAEACSPSGSDEGLCPPGKYAYA